ncbi:hypothetical protein DUI87_25839 [Hirundo rustica rustica]|uniref:Uncharacterized protein n=1 Tax=Hirundo rustica rustica TaxID=333673 RepID=A0A3M0JA01_HIRRU|nr:hypothetical protein DUI87_25839 [Hirundo rustica rustica]
MIGQLAAAVCSVYGIAYSGYYLTHLARHLTRVFRGDDPESTEATALSALAPSAPGEEAKEEPKEGNYCLIPAAVTAQLEYSKPNSKDILKCWMLYLKCNVHLCAWGAAWDKRSQGCGSRAAEQEPACAQVAKKAKGILAGSARVGQQEQGSDRPPVLGTLPQS